jgi:hypothetical protein
MQGRERRSRLVVIVASLALGGWAVGCGDEEAEPAASAAAPEPVKLAIETSGSGDDVSVAAPKSVPGGVVRIEFTNKADEESGLQLARIDGNHTGPEGLRRGEAWAAEGKPLPGWLHAAGGVGVTRPGATGTVVQELPPGHYAVGVDVGDNPTAEFEVREPADEAELPAPEGRITAKEYGFESSGLRSGENRVLFVNAGSEPHFIEALPLKPGKTVADVREFLHTEKGEPPVEERYPISTATIEGGEKQVVTMKLKKGSYVLLCFVPDRKGGPPHIMKGMLSQAEVR